MHAKFEKKQVEEFSYYGILLSMLLMGDLSKMEIAVFFRVPVRREITKFNVRTDTRAK